MNKSLGTLNRANKILETQFRQTIELQNYEVIEFNNVLQASDLNLLNLSFQKVHTNRLLVVFGVNTFAISLNH